MIRGTTAAAPTTPAIVTTTAAAPTTPAIVTTTAAAAATPSPASTPAQTFGFATIQQSEQFVDTLPSWAIILAAGGVAWALFSPK